MERGMAWGRLGGVWAGIGGEWPGVGWFSAGAANMEQWEGGGELAAAARWDERREKGN